MPTVITAANSTVTSNTSFTGANNTFTFRPLFAGNVPWDAGNFNPSNYAALNSNPTFTGTVNSNYFVSNLGLAIKAANTSVAGGYVIIDTNQQLIRFYESNSPYRGAYIDLTTSGAQGQIWTSGNFTPSNYAALSGAVFSGNVTLNGNNPILSISGTGDARLSIRSASADANNYATKMIYSTINDGWGGSGWLFRSQRTVDNTYYDYKLPPLAGGAVATIWTTASFDPSTKVNVGDVVKVSTTTGEVHPWEIKYTSATGNNATMYQFVTSGNTANVQAGVYDTQYGSLWYTPLTTSDFYLRGFKAWTTNNFNPNNYIPNTGTNGMIGTYNFTPGSFVSIQGGPPPANNIASMSGGGAATEIRATTVTANGVASAGPAIIQFNRPGNYAAHFGLDTDGAWKVGGWSMGQVAYRLWHEGNFTPSNYINYKTMNGGVGYENLNANNLLTVGETRFVNIGGSSNFPSGVSSAYYYGFGGGDIAGRGAQMIIGTGGTAGDSLWFRQNFGANNNTWNTWRQAVTTDMAGSPVKISLSGSGTPMALTLAKSNGQLLLQDDTNVANQWVLNSYSDGNLYIQRYSNNAFQGNRMYIQPDGAVIVPGLVSTPDINITGTSGQITFQDRVAPTDGNIDFDVRMIASGGNANTVGQGVLSFTGSRFIFGGDIVTYRANSPGTGVIYLTADQSRYLYYDGTNYVLPASRLSVNGNFVWTNADISWNAAQSGYYKFPNGLMIQWGYDTSGNSNIFIGFPVAFPNAVFYVGSTMASDQGSGVAYATHNYVPNNSGFNMRKRAVINGGIVQPDGSVTRWLAIGY